MTFIYENEKFLWIDPVELSRGFITGMMLGGGIFSEKLPISDSTYRINRPTQAQIHILHNRILIIDDYGSNYVIKFYKGEPEWVNLVRISAKENRLLFNDDEETIM